MAGNDEKALKQLRNLLVMTAPSTIPRGLRVFNTKTKQYGTVTLAPGETIDDLPEHLDPNR